MLKLKTILHPTDYSEPSEYAFRLACSLARDHEASLVVLHVVLTLGPELVTHGDAETKLEPEAFQRRLWDDLREVQSPDPAVKVEHRLAEGDAAEQIVRVAREAGAELVVMGTHGRTWLERLLMGGVAEYVMRNAPCPVLTVKTPKHVRESS